MELKGKKWSLYEMSLISLKVYHFKFAVTGETRWRQRTNGRSSWSLLTFYFYLLLIHIDFYLHLNFTDVTKVREHYNIQYLFCFPYHRGNEKQMAPLSWTWARQGGRALKACGVKLKRLQVHFPGQWQLRCLHSCSSEEIRRAGEIRSSIG